MDRLDAVGLDADRLGIKPLAEYRTIVSSEENEENLVFYDDL